MLSPHEKCAENNTEKLDFGVSCCFFTCSTVDIPPPQAEEAALEV